MDNFDIDDDQRSYDSECFFDSDQFSSNSSMDQYAHFDTLQRLSTQETDKNNLIERLKDKDERQRLL